MVLKLDIVEKNPAKWDRSGTEFQSVHVHLVLNSNLVVNVHLPLMFFLRVVLPLVVLPLVVPLVVLPLVVLLDLPLVVLLDLTLGVVLVAPLGFVLVVPLGVVLPLVILLLVVARGLALGVPYSLTLPLHLTLNPHLGFKLSFLAGLKSAMINGCGSDIHTVDVKKMTKCLFN